MHLIIKDNYQELSIEAAKMIKQAIINKPNLVLGLATGSTPLGCYQELIRMHKQENLDFSEVVIFNLDEYFNLPPQHHQSYHYFMKENLLNHINIDQNNFYIPNGMAKNVDEFCEQYENKIKEFNGIDFQLLGIGSDGHIGFNEPGTPFDSKTNLVELTESTINDNARFFEKKEDVPRFAITMGIQTIYQAKKIVLLASGENKAQIIKKTIQEPINVMVPASILQKHSDCTFILDKQSASKLKK